ncbi:M61 family metallopeptidase [Novosphingopyxis sp.]|uniref:M61 family metallopeptidase n=1 Tax=Novosphingopyxis sp. TaxID=2709690 RepID=UPI003B599EA5
MKNTLLATAALLTLFASPAIAQTANSAPIAPQLSDATPRPVDQPYPGTMTLDVDATDVARGIFRVKQTVPVAQAGPLTLLYPEWLPGKHGPRGAIDQLAGLKISAGGKPVAWTRDPLDVYAFRVDVPRGAAALDIEFQFLSPVAPDEGRIVVTPEMMNVQWEQVSLYPAGYYTRQIRVKPTITLPQGWTGATALDGASGKTGTIRYGETSYETLVDSPMFAGAHFRNWDLGQNVTLNVVADEAKNLEATPEIIDAHKRLVDEAVAVFGSRHFDHYEFLLALTDQLGGIGLEHHRSSENSRAPDYFTGWEDNEWERGLLPHEMTHSWNGKFRRPAGLWTPDFRTPMQDNLLWVYEGQTSFWDIILGVRSGLQSKEIALGEWARAAAKYANQPGRDWRSVEDTTFDPIMSARRPKPFPSWERSEDYYVEGSLIWLEADMIIRERTEGARSMNDFARAFFGINDGDWGEVTYTFDDIVAGLNAVAPYEWADFLTARLRTPGQPAPIAGFEQGGYTLVYREEPNPFDAAIEKEGGLDLSYSLGMSLSDDGNVNGVMWNGPAFKQDIVEGTKILSVNGREYSKDRMKDAITTTKESGEIELIVERGGRYRTIDFDYKGGLRYPHLEKTVDGEAPLDRLLMPLAR